MTRSRSNKTNDYRLSEEREEGNCWGAGHGHLARSGGTGSVLRPEARRRAVRRCRLAGTTRPSAACRGRPAGRRVPAVCRTRRRRCKPAAASSPTAAPAAPATSRLHGRTGRGVGIRNSTTSALHVILQRALGRGLHPHMLVAAGTKYGECSTRDKSATLSVDKNYCEKVIA